MKYIISHKFKTCNRSPFFDINKVYEIYFIKPQTRDGNNIITYVFKTPGEGLLEIDFPSVQKAEIAIDRASTKINKF